MPAFEAVRDDIRRLWDTIELRPERAGSAYKAATLVMAGRTAYENAGRDLGVPWAFIGIAHLRESSCNFETHLHNGDPLSARTVRVPPGRPVAGSPPFQWEESATDALRLKGLQNVQEWTIERILYEWERYNGFGYRNPGRGNTPYVWADTYHYERGKFVDDHVFDPDHVDTQNGCAAVLKTMLAIDPALLTELPSPVPIPTEIPPPTKEPSMWQQLINFGVTALLGILTGAGGMWGLTPSPTPQTPPPISQPAPTPIGSQCFPLAEILQAFSRWQQQQAAAPARPAVTVRPPAPQQPKTFLEQLLNPS